MVERSIPLRIAARLACQAAQPELGRLGTTPSQSMVVIGCWPANLYAAHRPPPPVAQAKTRRIAIVIRQRSDRALASSLLRPHAFPPGAGARLPLGLHIGV